MNYRTKEELIVVGIILSIIFGMGVFASYMQCRHCRQEMLGALQSEMYRYYDIYYEKSSPMVFQDKVKFLATESGVRTFLEPSGIFLSTNEAVSPDALFFAIRIRWNKQYWGIYGDRTLKQIDKKEIRQMKPLADFLEEDQK